MFDHTKYNTKVKLITLEGIIQFERGDQEYLKKDGSLNKKGLHELRYLRVKPFSYNDHKWVNFLLFHLSERTKTQWSDRLKNKEYLNNHDEYFNTWLLYQKIKSNIIHDHTHKECKKCKGHGYIFKVNVSPNKKCKACKGKGEIKK